MQFVNLPNKNQQALGSKPSIKLAYNKSCNSRIKNILQCGLKNTPIHKNQQVKNKYSICKTQKSQGIKIKNKDYRFEVVNQATLSQLRHFHHAKLLETSNLKKDIQAQHNQKVNNTTKNNFNKILSQIKDELKSQLHRKMKKSSSKQKAYQSLDNKKQKNVQQERFQRYDQNAFKERVFRATIKEVDDDKKTVQLNKKLKVLDHWLDNQSSTIELAKIDYDLLRATGKASQNLVGLSSSKNSKRIRNQVFRRKNNIYNAIFRQQKRTIQRIKKKANINANQQTPNNQDIKRYQSQFKHFGQEDSIIQTLKYTQNNQNLYYQSFRQFQMKKNQSLQGNQFTKRTMHNQIKNVLRQKPQKKLKSELNGSCIAFQSENKKIRKQDEFQPFNMPAKYSLMTQKDQEEYVRYIKSKIKTQSKIGDEERLIQNARNDPESYHPPQTQLILYSTKPNQKKCHSIYSIEQRTKVGKEPCSKESKKSNQPKVLQSKRCFKQKKQIQKVDKWDFNPW